jgi:hypothetical protein
MSCPFCRLPHVIEKCGEIVILFIAVVPETGKFAGAEIAGDQRGLT